MTEPKTTTSADLIARGNRWILDGYPNHGFVQDPNYSVPVCLVCGAFRSGFQHG